MASAPKEKPMVDQRFQIFDAGYEDVSVQSEKYIEFRPLAKIDRGQSVDITVPRSGSYYYDLSRSFFRFKVKITKNKGVAITSADKVAFINHPGVSIWSSIAFYIESEDFGRTCGPLLSYKYNMDSLIYRSTEYLESVGQSCLFFKDTPGAMDGTDPTLETGVNQGLLQRYNFSKSGGEMTLRTNIPIDLSDSLSQYLPNSLEIRVRLFPALDRFAVMSSDPTETYEIHVSHAALCLLAITPTPRMLQLHEEEFKRKNAVFHYDKSILKSYSIPKGSPTWEIESIFGSGIPKKLLVAFISTSSFVGSQSENPFNYANWGLTSLTYEVEGLKTRKYNPDFDNHHWTEEYNNLYSSPTGAARSGIIQLTDFKSGYAIYRVDNIESIFKTRVGQSRLTVTFKEALTKGVTCICYGKFPAKFMIDSTRNLL